MLALAAGVADLGDCGRAVLEQPLLVFRIDPGLGNDEGAVARADLLLVGLDQKVERGGVDIALLGQHGFERANAQLRFRKLGMVVVVVMVMVMIVVVCHVAYTTSFRGAGEAREPGIHKPIASVM